MFIDQLVRKIKEKNNPTIMGLDPRIEFIPEFIKDKFFENKGKTLAAVADSIIEFNKKLIDAVCDIIPAVKPQLAYYEMYGLEGMRAYKETISYAGEKGLLVLADGKRNDIGSTATAYSSAYLGKVDVGGELLTSGFEADALTVNPYLGIDGIKPFMNDCIKYGKGIFILAKTSNPSSGQLQDILTVKGKPVYQLVVSLIREWGGEIIGDCGYSSIGAVIGATYPEQLRQARSMMPEAFILVPGYGAQGGTAEDIAGAFDEKGLGALVNASRSLMCAYKHERWKGEFKPCRFDEACRAEALRMRQDLLSAI